VNQTHGRARLICLYLKIRNRGRRRINEYKKEEEKAKERK